ncbi:MAG: membrane protein insertion efficiency factor YidD [Planctomycetes bacterium]|nr:membrane protein insertion efficiency factor YidD [Planctomycetota bacterium]
MGAIRIAVAAAGRWAAEGAILLVRGYRALASPLMGRHCRFAPSCSQYAVEALRTHGLLRGLGLAAWRVLRCNPLGRSGYDPVPPRKA